MDITFSSMPRDLAGAAKDGVLAAGVFKKGQLSRGAAALDQITGGALSRAMAANGFDGSPGKDLVLEAPAGVKAARIVLFGLGAPAALDPLVLRRAGGALIGTAARLKAESITVLAEGTSGAKTPPPQIAAHMAFGAALAGYRFDKYKTRTAKDDAGEDAEEEKEGKGGKGAKASDRRTASPPVKPGRPSRVVVAVANPRSAVRAYTPMDKLAAGVRLTRDLVSEPSNIKYPETLAAEAAKLSSLGVKVEVLDEKQLKKLGMGALLGVAQGSARPPRVVIMRWQGATGAKKSRPPIAFVGKGVTFDSGGISIKPAGGMEDMKWDMGGAGVVIGLMAALAGRKAKVNAVGIVGLVENMPSGTAQRPGDIVTSLSGQTIEVLNTDAEGRLVLADVLWHVQEKEKPRIIIDLATLTGAIIVALGETYAGLFSNDDRLAEQLTAAGEATGDRVWRLPLDDSYDRMLESDAADMKNIGGGRSAGSITAAQFLQRFIQKGVKWAHLDIAGVTWAKKPSPTVPKGGTGFGVQLLDRWVADHHER